MRGFIGLILLSLVAAVTSWGMWRTIEYESDKKKDNISFLSICIFSVLLVFGTFLMTLILSWGFEI